MTGQRNATFDLTGHTAVITGGNRGIGLGLGRAMAEAGANVALWGRDGSTNAQARDELAAIGGKVVAVECDVAEPDQVADAVRRTVDALGPISCCYANAGVRTSVGSALEITPEEWRRVMRVNLDGAFFTLREVAAHMVEAEVAGSLVAISSASARRGFAAGPHYSASKGALNSLVRSLALAWARHDIRVNAIIAGRIEVEDHPPTDAKSYAKLIGRIPMRHAGSPADLAGIAVYLASDASKYHTGDCLTIDGGLMAS